MIRWNTSKDVARPHQAAGDGPATGEFKKWQSLGQAHRKDHYVDYALDLEHPTANPTEIGEGYLRGTC